MRFSAVSHAVVLLGRHPLPAYGLAMLLTTMTALALVTTALTVPAPMTSIPTRDIHDQLTDLVANREITAGLVFVDDGAERWSDAVGVRDLASGRPARADGHFRIGSITKTFVAVVLLQLVDEGRLVLDDPIDRYLPGVVPNGDRITVRQILHHDSGLYDYASEPGYSTNRWRGAARFDDYSPYQLLEVAFSKDPDPEPGVVWDYSNTNYVVAGLLIEELTGQPYGAEVQRRILEPLELVDTSVPGNIPSLPTPHARGYESVQAGGESIIVDATEMDPSLDYAAGEIISTTRDLDRFLDALLSGHLMSAESLEEMRRTTEAEPGLSRYGLGLQEYSLSCPSGPKNVLGHTGKLVGYVSVALSDGNGTSVVLSLNPYERDPAYEAVADIVTTVFC